LGPNNRGRAFAWQTAWQTVSRGTARGKSVARYIARLYKAAPDSIRISVEDAENELLLKLDPASASTLSPSASQLPPPQLELSIERFADGWRIANRSPGYAWRDCSAAAGNSTARLPRLEPKAAVIVNPLTSNLRSPAIQ